MAWRGWSVAAVALISSLIAPSAATAEVSVAATLSVLAAPVERVAAGGGGAEPGVTGMDLAEGDRINTGTDGVALITFLNGSTVTLLADSEITVRQATTGRGKSGIRLLIHAGRVTAHAKGQIAPGRSVLLRVQDSGSGMDDATLGKIFEPFFTTKEPGKGTGLGLATVYGIVHQSGGTIGVDSAPGRGTTFTIYLPRIDAPEAPAGQAGLERGDETILLVEDDHEVRQLAAEVLKAAGYTVLESGDPLEALVIGDRHRDDIRLLISDMVMPAMHGPALAAQILQIQPEARVLYMSGYTTEAIASQGTIDPPGPLLQKPFTPDGLARIVRQALDSTLATR